MRFETPSRLAALLLGTLVLSPMQARAQTDETGGIGGTGIKSETGGIGGTGVKPETGGIGGTGLTRQGQPILGYGPIQAFGSVFVNGREYVIDAHTLVTVDGAPAAVAALRIGDIAQIRGEITSPRGGYASTVTVVHPLIGPLGEISSGGRGASLLGQNITAAGAGAPLFAGFRPGEIVAVSAQLRANGTWAATEVAPAATGAGFQLAGRVDAFSPGHISIAGTLIAAPRTLTDRLATGEAVVVAGKMDGGAPVATAITLRDPIIGQSGTRVEVRDYFRSEGNGLARAPDGLAAANVPASVSLHGEEPVELIGTLGSAGVIDVDEINLANPPPADTIEPVVPARPEPDDATPGETPEPDVPITEPSEAYPEPPEIELPEGPGGDPD
jgi:hypothetical protein